MCLSMTAGEHAALYVHEPITSGVSTEETSLVSIIHGESVTVSQTQVTILIEYCPVTVTTALVIHSHPV